MDSEVVAQEDPQEEQQESMSDFNKKQVKQFLAKAKVTAIFMCIILLTFILEVIMTWTMARESGFGLRQISPGVLTLLGANVPVLVQDGQIYRLLTATILHAGGLHILMNSFSLIGFCAQIEPLVSAKYYLLVYIVGGIQGNMLFDFKNIVTKNVGDYAVGASTSICAIMGLFIAFVIVLYFKGADVKELKKNIVMMLIILAAISLMPGVDFFGHFGSLFSGLFLGVVLLAKSETPSLKKLRIAGVVCLVLYTLMMLSIWII